MGFWEDATPATKGTIVVGGLLIVYFALAYFVGLWPYNAVSETVQTRGLPPASAAP
ncbi:MAG: hypothetical protein U0234_03030 [Sandaracinus sp.]